MLPVLPPNPFRISPAAAHLSSILDRGWPPSPRFRLENTDDCFYYPLSPSLSRYKANHIRSADFFALAASP